MVHVGTRSSYLLEQWYLSCMCLSFSSYSVFLAVGFLWCLPLRVVVPCSHAGSACVARSSSAATSMRSSASTFFSWRHSVFGVEFDDWFLPQVPEFVGLSHFHQEPLHFTCIIITRVSFGAVVVSEVGGSSTLLSMASSTWRRWS